MDEPNEYVDAPVKVLAAIRRWVEYRDYPGSFVTRLLCNDLVGTIRSADEQSLEALPTILRYLHNEAPTQCYGSEEKVTAWGNGPDHEQERALRPGTEEWRDDALRKANVGTLQTYLDAERDIGEASGGGAD